MFPGASDYGDMESFIMCLAAPDRPDRAYALGEMINIFGEKELHDALRLCGAEYGLEEYSGEAS